jgi:hypothetical protein
MMEEKILKTVYDIVSKTISYDLSPLKVMTDEESKEWHKHHSKLNRDGSMTISSEIIN